MFRACAALAAMAALGGRAAAQMDAAKEAFKEILDKYKNTGQDIKCDSPIAALSFDCAELVKLSAEGKETSVADASKGVTLTSGSKDAALYKNVGVLPDGTRVDYKVMVCEAGVKEIGPDPKEVPSETSLVERPKNTFWSAGTRRVPELTYTLKEGMMSLQAPGSTKGSGWTSMCGEFVDPSGNPITVSNVGFTALDIDSNLENVMTCGVDGKITSENSEPPLTSSLLTKVGPSVPTQSGTRFYTYPKDCVEFSTVSVIAGATPDDLQAGGKLTEEARKNAGAFLMNSVDHYQFGLGSSQGSELFFSFDPKSILGCPVGPRNCADPPKLTKQQQTQQSATPQPTEAPLQQATQQATTVPTLKPQQLEPGLPQCWAGSWGGGSQASCIAMTCGGGESTCLDEYKKQLLALDINSGDSNDPTAPMAGGMTECDLMYKKVLRTCPQCEKCTPPGSFTPKLLYEAGPPAAPARASGSVMALWVAALGSAAAATATLAFMLARSRGRGSRAVLLAATDAEEGSQHLGGQQE